MARSSSRGRGPRSAGQGQRGPKSRGGAGEKNRGPRSGGPRGASPRGGVPRGAHQGARPASDLVVGRRACAEALEAGIPLRRALVAAGSDQDQTLAALVRRLEAAGVPVESVPKARLDSLSNHGVHQGVVAQASPFDYAELADVIQRAGQGDALVVLLDHVIEEEDLGAVVRFAEAVGAAGVVIAKARAVGVGVRAHRASAGAVRRVPVAQVPNLAAAIDELKQAGFWVACPADDARQDAWSAPLEGRLCLVVGPDGTGVSRLVRQKCDFECRLPQRGRASLGAAQAATVMCYEWLRRESQRAAGEAE